MFTAFKSSGNLDKTGPSAGAQCQGHPFFQPKLTVNAPGDSYEQEADAMTDKVMRMETDGVSPGISRNITPLSNLQRKCTECEQEEEQNVQMSRAGSASPYAGDWEQSVGETLSGEGRALPENTRSFMSARFGRDFGEVRIHTDPQASVSAGAIQAKAYTSGNHIVFGSGHYQPETNAGQRLLAHELTHVVQQGGAGEKIQRDGDEDASGGGTFDFDFDLLPPSLKIRLGGLLLQADTGEAELRFSHDLVRYRLGYAFGGDLFFGAREGSSSSRLGVNPSTGGVSLGLSEGPFRFGTSFNPFSGAFGFNLGFGSPLLPMPGELTDPVSRGGAGVSGILGGLGGFRDPFQFYQSQEQNIDAVMGAVRAVTPLADPERRRFGTGLRFTYNPDTGVLIHAGMQWFF